mgnify:CR=1 FL=1
MKALFVALISLLACSSKPAINTKNFNTMDKTIYQFKVEDITGNEFDFDKLKGKKIMIVNTASKCGFTPQYEQLEELYQKYKDDNFVTFPMMSKISVKGKDMHPVYQFLTTKELNGVMDSKVGWNFQKYLINEKGVVEKMIPSKTNPLDQEIIDWIEQ